MKVLFFAGLREAVGCDSELLSLPESVRDVAGLRGHLAQRGGCWQALESMPQLRVAVNQRMCGMDAPVADTDEVAFFPPVTGG